MSSKKTAVVPTRGENFPEWYQQVIKVADLAENSLTRGCMIILPLGQAVWENIQRYLDAEFKLRGTENVYFPLLIPLELRKKEAEHVEGFAKECAVVTHRRLEIINGELSPSAPLQEPYVIRPTSEMVIGEAFSRWVKSYRDLPININQWANVMRWEMRPRIFLRTAEFLWQEGHTVHASDTEANAKALEMLEVYRQFLEEILAIPVTPGEKSESERFPGAEATYTVEAMMQDGKALQAGTSHFLGQNFAKAQNIRFLDQDEQEKYGWTTSWGVSTRMIGGLIMTHSDDNGLVLPPKICRYHVAIVPVLKKDQDSASLNQYIENLKNDLEKQTFNGVSIKVYVDRSEDRGGDKYWRQIKKGTPLILEIGHRDQEKNAVFLTKRLGLEKASMNRDEFSSSCCSLLDEQQNLLFKQAKERTMANLKEISSVEEFKKLFAKNDESSLHPFVLAPVDDNETTQKILKEHQASIRCYPLVEKESQYTCVFSGKPCSKKAIVARSY